MAAGRGTNYTHQSAREGTFTTWPHRRPSKHEVAAAGFIYTGYDDKVECYACGISLDAWTAEHDPWQRHRQNTEACPIVEAPIINGGTRAAQRSGTRQTGFGTPAVSSGPSTLNPLVAPAASAVYAFTGSGSGSGSSNTVTMHMNDGSGSTLMGSGSGSTLMGSGSGSAVPMGSGSSISLSGYTSPQSSQDPRLNIMRNIEIADSALTVRTNPDPFTRYSGPHNNLPPRRLKLLENRLGSFVGKPWTSPLAPETLAKAGFFYLGPGDRVQCAYCGGKLKKWKPTHSPIDTHVRYFPDCSFVQMISKQSAALAKNIRTRQTKENRPSAEELKKQEQMKRTGANPLFRIKHVLNKMNYDDSQIRRAQNRLRSQELRLDLVNFMSELQTMAKEEHSGTLPQVDNDEDYDGDEEEEEEKTDDLSQYLETPAHLVEEVISKLQYELRHTENEHEELTKQMTCKVCLTAPMDTLFLGCRHLVACKDCADRLKDCPICRDTILGTIDVFIGRDGRDKQQQEEGLTK